MNIGPPPAIAERARRLLQNGVISYPQYLLALNTGVLPGNFDDEDPDAPELISKLVERLAENKGDKKAYKAIIEEILKLRNGLTHIAIRIKRKGKKLSGETVEVAVAQNKDGKFLIAGLNSSAGRWSPEQLNELKRLGILAAPLTKGLPKNQPHAEENIAYALRDLDARWIKVSNAPVGAGKPHSDVCPVCRGVIRNAGAEIEPGMHQDTVPPVLPKGQGHG